MQVRMYFVRLYFRKLINYNYAQQLLLGTYLKIFTGNLIKVFCFYILFNYGIKKRLWLHRTSVSNFVDFVSSYAKHA